MSTINPIPSTLSDLLVDLKTISSVKRGQKINMTTMTFSQSDSWYSSLSRYILGESREKLIVDLKQLFKNAIIAIEEHYATEFCSMVVSALDDSKTGLRNLIATYQDDPGMISELEVMICNIDLQLKKNSQYLMSRATTFQVSYQ